MRNYNFQKRLFTLALFLLLNGANYFINAQQVSTITGRVLDKEGKSISDVKVSIPSSLTSKAISKVTTLSNNEGEYKLHLIFSERRTDTTVILEFSHVSFGIRLRTVKATAGEVAVPDIIIDATKMLDTVTITDKSTRANFIQQIPTKDIYLQTGASGDFNVVLFTQLGVQQSNELSSAYSVRGGNFDENLVYVNDIEVYRPFLTHSGQQEGLSFVNSDLVSSIYFSSGGFEAKYGDKMSSVLDIRYKKPREFGGSISGGLLGGALHLEGASKDNRFTYLLGARQKSNSYLLNSLDIKGNYKPFFFDVQSFITFNPNTEWEFNVLANTSQNKYRVIPLSRKSSFGTVNNALQLNILFDGQELDKYQTYMGAFSSIYRPTDKDLTLKFITSAFNTDESETFDILGQYLLSELENDFGKDNFGKTGAAIGAGAFLNHARNYLNATVYNFEHKGNKQWKDKNRQLWWGVKYQHEIINDKLSEWTLIDSAGYSLPNVKDSTGYIDPKLQPYKYMDLYEVIKSTNKISSNRYSGFIQHAWEWDTKDTGELTLTTGVRANYWDINNQLLISPRATLSYKPHWKRNILFKASSGYYYQPPFYRELRDFYGVLHTNLKAQESIHFVLGSDLDFTSWGRPFKFISEVYYKKLNDLIPYEIDNVRIRYFAQNDAVGYATGIDMKMNGEFVKGIDSWASLSIMKTMEDIKNDYYYDYYNNKGEKIIPGYTTNNIIADSVLVHPGYIPRPTDQRVTFSLFFQDYLPKLPRCKMHLNLLFGSGLPFGPPLFKRYLDILRMPPYRRVDIGFSYEIIKEKMKDDSSKQKMLNLKSIWFSVEVFNLLAVNNVVSYIWVRDAAGRQYAVPNYLSSRLFNARVMIKF